MLWQADARVSGRRSRQAPPQGCRCHPQPLLHRLLQYLAREGSIDCASNFKLVPDASVIAHLGSMHDSGEVNAAVCSTADRGAQEGLACHNLAPELVVGAAAHDAKLPGHRAVLLHAAHAGVQRECRALQGSAIQQAGPQAPALAL